MKTLRILLALAAVILLAGSASACGHKRVKVVQQVAFVQPVVALTTFQVQQVFVPAPVVQQVLVPTPVVQQVFVPTPVVQQVIVEKVQHKHCSH